MSLKIKKIDIILTVACTIISLLGLGLFLANSQPGADARVYVYIDNVEVRRAPLSVDAKFEFTPDQYPVLIANLVVEVKNHKVAVTYEESPRNLCSAIGFVSLVNYPIVCLPNRTLVVIRDGSVGYYV